MPAYFWKKNGGIYHWHLQCTQIPIHVRRAPDWAISDERPKDKEPCKECREKDIKDQLNGKIK